MTASIEETSPGRPLVVLSPEFKADSPRRFAQLRAQGPIHRVRLANGIHAWAVVSYPQARAALTHPLLLKDPTPSEKALAAANYTTNRPGVGLGGNMLESDPPEHGRLRRLAANAFSPRRTEALAPRIQEIADELLDAIAPLGEADLVDTFTGPLPMTVICELLGVPKDERSDFRSWTSAALSPPSESQLAGAVNLNQYLTGLVQRKRSDPQEDLLTALVAIRDEEDGRLSESELVATAVLLVVAGHDTTVNLLGNTVVGFFRQPEQADLLRARPELITTAVEEFLRYDPPVEYSTLRYAAAHFQFGDQPISRGDVVMVALGSAGRDAPQADDGDPALLDVERATARHIAFGHGIHHCLGAPLARLEATIAIGTLLRRLPDLRPAIGLDEVPWTPAGMMRGPRRLPVRFTPQSLSQEPVPAAG